MFLADTVGVCCPWIAAVVVLVVTRRNFSIPASAGTLGVLARRAVLSAVVSGALWIGGALVLSGGFHPQATVGRIIAAWPLRYLPPFIGDYLAHPLVPVDESTLNLSVWTGVVFWGGILLSLWRAFIAVPDPDAGRSRAAAAAVLADGDGDHLARMTLWKDNCYWFDEPTGAYVAYRVHRAVAVTLGEPVLPAAAIDAAVAAAGGDGGETQREEITVRLRREVAARFERFVSLKGLRIAWYAVRDSFARACRADGWRSVVVAEEAVVATSLADFRGKKFQDVRTARNRAKKEGIHVEWIRWQSAGPALTDKIISLSEDWVADKALPEMGFTLGGIDELKDSDIELAVAVDDNGRVHGVTSWLPVITGGQVTGVILDFMRRDTGGFRPVVEFLIAEALVRAADKGMPWISLSAAPLAHTGQPDDRLGEFLDKVGASMEPLYGFRSLAFFKKKFHPDHVPWLLLYRDELALPAIGMAIAQCYLPQVGAGQLLRAAKVMAGDHARG
nr:phosphatidylglycerol lysyltransferase domain-containing protein [Corynebacterium mendelii]